jgi:outer membrane protein
VKINISIALLILLMSRLFANESYYNLQKEDKRTISLSEAIEKALQNNPDLKAKKSDIVVQTQKLKIAQSANLPSLNLEGSLDHFSQDQRLVAATYNSEIGEFGDNFFKTNLKFTLPLYMGGKIVANIKAKEYLVLAQNHLLVNSQNQLIFNVKSIFWYIYAQEKAIDSFGFAIKTMQKHKQEVHLQYELKKVARVELLKTDVRIAELNQKKEDEENKLTSLYSLLYATLGIENSFSKDFLRVDVQGLKMNLEYTFAQPKELYTIALENRGDYLSMKDKLNSLNQEVIVAKSANKPTLKFYGNLGYRNIIDTSDEDNIKSSVGMAFNIPLYTGGANEAKVVSSYASLESYRQRLHSLQLSIQSDINNAVADFVSSKKRAKLSKDSITLALENLRIEELKYQLGKGSQIDLFEAQSLVLNAQTNYIKMQSLAHIAYAKISYLIGSKHLKTTEI